MVKNYTICGKQDGFGAQYQSIMSGIVYCEFNNLNYVHTPISKIHHGEDIISLNKFIGIPILRNRDKIKIDISEQFSKKVYYSRKPSIYYTKKAVDIIRKYYYSTPKPKI